MYGTITQNNSGRGISYYRAMTLASLVSNVVFGFLYVVVLDSGRELIWDRVLVFIFSLFVFIRSFSKNTNTSEYASLVYLLFFVNTTHVIWTVAYNDFDGFYFLSLFITTQACAYSFRDESSTFWYLIYMCVVTFTGLFLISDIDPNRVGIHSAILIVITVLQYLASRVKCRFMREMKMNQEMLRSLISKSEDAVFLTDMNGNIFDVNPRVTELFGYERNEMLDHDFKLLRKNALTGNEIEFGLNELETKRFWTMETSLVRKDKSEFPVRISITLIKNGLKKYLVYRVMDITLAKENETKIIEARDSAEEAVRAKGQFLAIMSHEIRTPLNGVIATASMLQQTSLDTEQEEYTETIKKSGQSLLMLINDILEFSKMESGKMLLDPQAFKVNEAIFDVSDLLRPHAEAKGIDLFVNMDSTVPPFMWIDGHRLKQVLFNLTGNAIKFTDTGKVEISCACTEINKDDVTLSFKVKDSGIGIPGDKMHLLFQSFSQVDSSTSRRFGGTGLGLAISKQIVELMGGHFEVSSEMGVGTTFTFFIKGKICQEAKQLSEHNIPAFNPALDLSNLKVLVGEDNEINRLVLKFILDDLKINAQFAMDGAEVVKACAETDFDLVFMDMQMPLMDGLEATREIRSSQVNQPYIVAITANTFDDDRRRCAEAGMSDFLAKPFEPDQLKAIIAKWFSLSGRDVHSAA